MMRIQRCLTCVFLLVACLGSTAAFAEDPVYFADANLKMAVERALGVSNPTPSDMLRLTEFDAFLHDIRDLTGLEYATNLWNLNLNGNEISDLLPLSGLTKLAVLTLPGNEIHDLSPLSNLTRVYSLNLSSNPIVNFSGLSGLVRLQSAGLESTGLSDLSPLSGLTSLQMLSLSNNKISDLAPLSGLTNLGWLTLNNNQISDLSPLAGLTSLFRLDAQSNRINNISALSGLTKLQSMDLVDNQISDISALSGFVNWTRLDLSDNRIADLSPLSGLTNLTMLNLENNQVCNLLPLSSLVNLRSLWLDNNLISDLSPLSALTSLKLAYLNNNEVSDLSPLLSLTNLITVGLANNQISVLPQFPDLPNLVALYLNNNSIADFSPLSSLTSLLLLNLDNNQTNDLSPLSALTSLESLSLDNNQTNDLSPLSALTSLESLSLNNNQISDLSPLSGLTKLSGLSLENNQISDLSPLASLTSLNDLWLTDNRISDVSPLIGLTNLHKVLLRNNPLGRDAYCHDLGAIYCDEYFGFVIFDTPNRNPPGETSATNGTHDNKVTITWSALCPGPSYMYYYPDDGSEIFQYMVSRSTSLDGTKVAVSGWLDGTSFDDTTASPGVHYWYWVKSNNSGEAYSDPAEGWRSLPTGPSLLIFSTGHGWVTTPGEGAFSYAYGTSVPVVATPVAPYAFINWTGTAVDAGKVADPATASTTVMVDGPYTLQANFTTVAPGVMRALTTASTAGGSVWEPGEGTFEYEDGTEVPLVAVPDDGYQFAGWTGTAVDAGKVADPESASITLTMDADYTLTANFEPAGGPLEYELVMSAGTGGYVSEPGEGTFAYEVITTVPIVAHAYTGYRFSRWTGTAVNAGKVASTTSENTTVMVDGDYNLQANFVRSGQFSVKVLAPNGGETLLAGGTFAIHWQMQGEIGSLRLDLTTDGGSTWTHVSSANAGTGAYDWTVPKIDSDHCLIRISVLDNAAIADVSDAFFSIHKPVGHIWYVDAAAAPGGDGTSWETAFICLQDGLAHAADGDSVWVAEGLYWPDLGGGQATGDRAATFRLPQGVTICGGFPTGGGTWGQRNPFLHPSILSGDIGTPNVNADNSYHVVNGSGTDKTAVLDGCTIVGGFANGTEPQDRGAGLYNLWGSPQIRNCILVGNAAAGDGGGAWNSQSAATFVNCVFNGNTAGNNGGGLYSEQGDVTITNCTFTANEALWRAGGVFNASGTAEVVNCILWNNSRMGGASYDELAQVSGDPKPALSYCCVQGWTGSLGGQNNFGRDPLFLDAAGADDVVGTPDDDLRLQPGSPCIDKGDNAAVPPEAATDQQGDPRIISNAVDMGAYEFGAMPAPSETGGP